MLLISRIILPQFIRTDIKSSENYLIYRERRWPCNSINLILKILHYLRIFLFVPCKMNVRARRDGGRGRAQPQASGTSTQTTSVSSTAPTATVQETNSTPSSSSSSVNSETRTSTAHSDATRSSTAPQEPAPQPNVPVNSIPGMMQATVDFTQAFRVRQN